jgi:hypothetical protein
MRAPAPPPGLSPRELGQWMLRTGTWLSGTAARGTLRQLGADWQEAEPVTPERWYRELVAAPETPAEERYAEVGGLDLEAG